MDVAIILAGVWVGYVGDIYLIEGVENCEGFVLVGELRGFEMVD